MFSSKNQDYDYWMIQKRRYEINLKNGYGDKSSIKCLLKEINNKLYEICKSEQKNEK